jgi:hypothetical protein
VLKEAHVGNAQVQAQMCATYRSEYENFTHLPGESIDAMFKRFTVVMNNMRANVDVLPYDDHDRAVKLLHSLDRTIWCEKFEAIVESEKYDTLTVNELFSKLKSAVVDRGMTAKLEGPTDSHCLALVGGSKGKANTNPSTRMFYLSSLMSMPNEEFDLLGEDELELLTRRFERLHENRVNMRRNTRTCFQCGRPGHFIADCPEKIENKDGYKQKSTMHGKYRSRRDHKNKHKDERQSRKKESRGKARAMVGASDVDSSSAYSTSSSSSSEDEGDHRKSRKSSKNLSGLSCFAREGFYTMALSSGSNKSTPSDSDSNSNDEVRDELPFLHQENERLGLLLDNRDDMLREAKKMRKGLRASLDDARTRVAKLETPNLDAKLEIDSLKASRVVFDDVECADCSIFLADLALFREKHASKCEELDVLRVEVTELKSRSALLGACTSCPVLHGKIDEMHAYTISFDARSVDGIFFGYGSHSRTYRVLNLETNQIGETCEVTFDETQPRSQPVFECAGDDELGEEIFQEEEHELGDDEDGVVVPPAEHVPITSTTVVDGPSATPTTTNQNRGEAIVEREVASRRKPPQRVQVDHPASRIVGGMNEHTTRSRFRNNSHFAHAPFVAIFEPKDIGHALFDHNWVNSMHEELENFERNQVWELVDPPRGCKPIGTKCVCKNKEGEKGEVVRNKSRLVAQGFSQKEGIDYEETSLP